MNAWYARGRTGEQVLDAVEMMLDAKSETDFEWGVLRLERIGFPPQCSNALVAVLFAD